MPAVEQLSHKSYNTEKEENKIRVFISYSHNNRTDAEKVAEALTANGFEPMWDRNFLFGHGFHDQIETSIAHSHVFLPIITKESNERGWVHQEIGYAMALNIPILPVAIEALPEQMIHGLHAIQLSQATLENPEQLQNFFSKRVFDTLIGDYRDPTISLLRCAELHEDRTIMMAQYANSIVKLGYFGFVRQKGGLSSFHIPNAILSDPVWKERYGNKPKSEYHCKLQLNERLALSKHAENAGCKLIIHSGEYIEKEYGLNARLVRLQTLHTFLNTIPEDVPLQVVINPDLEPDRNLTLVGNWFYAESISGSLTGGYRHTVFSQHAPSIQNKIELFDQEFKYLLSKAQIKPEESRQKVSLRIEEMMQNIKERMELESGPGQ